MPGSFRYAPGCGCCAAECALLLGPFCDCCGLLAAGSIQVWNDAGYDKSFSVTNGYATILVPGGGGYHARLTGPYTPRSLPSFTVTQVYDAPSARWRCTSSAPVTAYAPPNRPASVVLTTPSGSAVTLTACERGTATCDIDQWATYMGSTTVTLTHGCWCSTASTISLPVMFRWRFAVQGQPCGLDTWVPACQTVTQISGAGVMLMLCGFAVSAPSGCMLPDNAMISTPPSGDPFHPTAPCAWLKLNNFDTLIYSQPTTCNPLYWRSGNIPSWAKTRSQCLAPSASSFVWPGGGYLTVTE